VSSGAEQNDSFSPWRDSRFDRESWTATVPLEPSFSVSFVIFCEKCYGRAGDGFKVPRVSPGEMLPEEDTLRILKAKGVKNGVKIRAVSDRGIGFQPMLRFIT